MKKQKRSKESLKSKDFKTVARALRNHDKHPVVNYKKLRCYEQYRNKNKEE